MDNVNLDKESIEMLRFCYKQDVVEQIKLANAFGGARSVDMKLKTLRNAGLLKYQTYVDDKNRVTDYEILKTTKGKAFLEKMELEQTEKSKSDKRERRREIREIITLIIAGLAFALSVIALVWQGIETGYIKPWGSESYTTSEPEQSESQSEAQS